MESSRRVPAGVLIVAASILVVVALVALIVPRAMQETHVSRAAQTPTAMSTISPCKQQLTGVAGDDMTTLRSVIALSQQNAWAVGAQGRHAVIVRWNGQNWNPVDIPVNVTTTSTFNAIAAVSAEDMWAVGRADLRPLIAHWNGSVWSQVGATPINAYSSQLSALAVVATNDVWAVGSALSAPQNGVTQAIAEHWDGHSWRTAPVPPGSAFDAITATADGKVWGLITTVGSAKQLVRWDGQAWHEQTMPAIPGLAPNSIQTILADDGRTLWVAGGWEPTGENWPVPFVAHWDGATWSRVSTNAPEARGAWFTSLAIGKDGTAWAAGIFKNFNTKLNDVLIENVGGQVNSSGYYPYPDLYAYPNTSSNLHKDDSFSVTGIAVVPGADTVWIVGGRGAVPDTTVPPIDSNLPVASGGFTLSFAQC